MSIEKLFNYLRAFRKRSGLSQEELALLFGVESGSVIWNYEHGRRLPSLVNLLAYEFVFQTSGRELFAGLYERNGERIIKRARKLAKKLDAQPRTDVVARKRRFLKILVDPEAPWNQETPAL